MKPAVAAIVVAVCALWCASLRAQVYACTGAQGATSFQDQPCKPGQRQRVINLPSRAPAGLAASAPAAASAASVEAPGASALPAPAPAPPPQATAPLPVMYACVDAVNRKPYLARQPRPPYLVPLGVLGYPPESLARAYGGQRGAGASAPELAHPRIGGPRIATGMTEVQDFCLPATHAEVCTWVQKAYTENHRKLRMAMPHEAPPLEARERRLTAELDHC